MKELETFIVKTAELARSSPRAWNEWTLAFREYSAGQRDNCVAAPAESLQNAQGRAQACKILERLFEDAVKTADRITSRRA